MSEPESPPTTKTGDVKWSNWLRKYGFEELFGIGAGQQHLFDYLVWNPCYADRLAAWQLYTELRTRVATQGLSYRSGDEAAALDSVYQLFELSRTIIKQYYGCAHFATLTVEVLNERVRPFTAKWHRLALDGQLASADVRYLFRRELKEVQASLRRFERLLGLLACDPAIIVEADTDIGVFERPTNVSEGFQDSIPWGIDARTSNVDNANEINDKEKQEVFARRKYYGLATMEQGTDAVGLAISGGGIRSATFALGVVQQLARKGILRQVDFLSTVSGGGYIGGFISSFLNDDKSEGVSLTPGIAALPFRREGDSESQGVRHLRNHSKYLSEGGVKTMATIVALVGYGLVVSVLLLAPLLLGSVWVTKLLWADSFTEAPGALFRLNTSTWIALSVLGLGVLLLPIPQNLGRNSRLQKWWERGCVGLAVLCVTMLACQSLPYIFRALLDVGGAKVALGAAALLPLLLGAVGLWLGARRLPGRIVFGLFGISGPLLVLAAFLWLCEGFIAVPFPDSERWLAGLTLGSLLYTSFVLNINFASPHLFYRDRIARTYLTRSPDGSDAAESIDPQPLSTMNSGHKSPYHLINAALNIPSCDDPNLRGRNTDFFLFSKYFCGSPILGYRGTTDWEAGDSHLDMGTAIAISGAAAAPHMGTLTSLRFTFLLAMLNIRLGYWARRPRGRMHRIEKYLPPVGWWYFFRELTGLMSEKSHYVNLSDGGHIENLGIYELLRRRCKFVIAIDGEADPKRSFGGLLKLAQLAKIDLGVCIEPDLSDLQIDRDGKGRAHFGMARIQYPDKQCGLLLYIKSSLTGNESEVLKKYHAEHPDFPHQSTAQQLFSETQFEAYRSLGEHIANDLFRNDLVETWEWHLSIREWFKRLATNLLS